MPIFTPIPQDDFVAAIHTLAAQLRADADWTPDFIIGIGRGGLVPAVFLSHAIGLPTLSVDYSSQVEDFAWGREHRRKLLDLMEQCGSGAG